MKKVEPSASTSATAAGTVTRHGCASTGVRIFA